MCPPNAESIPEIVRIARAHGVALYPISTGHNWGYGTALPVRDDAVIVDLSRLVRIDFDPEMGIVTVEPGVTQGMLAEFLARGGHPFLTPVHGGGPSCSILGNALERGYGITPHTDHFGAVLALEAILADGSTYRSPLVELSGAGGGPAFKWGIGPFVDGLFAQSGFGIVTRVSIALARTPERVRAVLFGLTDERFAEGLTAIRDVLRRLPGIVGGVNLMNAHRILAMAAPYPRESIGPDGLIPAGVIARLAARHRVHAWTGFATLYGSKRVVRAAQADIAAVAAPARASVRLRGPGGPLPRQSRSPPPGTPIRRLRPQARVAAIGPRDRAGATEPDGAAARVLAKWSLTRVRRPLDPARDGCGIIWYAPLVPMTPIECGATSTS